VSERPFWRLRDWRPYSSPPSLYRYQTTLRVALAIMLQFHEWLHIAPGWTIDSYVSFCLGLLLAFGLVFQLPVIILTLGYLQHPQLRPTPHRPPACDCRPFYPGHAAHAAAGCIYSTDDGYPLVLLYEICIWILYAMEHKPIPDQEVLP
jgi:hypothetical protein